MFTLEPAREGGFNYCDGGRVVARIQAQLSNGLLWTVFVDDVPYKTALTKSGAIAICEDLSA